MSSSSFNGGFVPKQINTGAFSPPGGPEAAAPQAAGRIDDPYYLFGAASRTDELAISPASQFATGHPYPYYDFLTAEIDLQSEPAAGIATPVAAPVCRQPSVPRSGRPLNVVHIGPHLQLGGAEQWLLDLAGSLDPSVMRISRHVAVNAATIDVEYVTRLAEANISVEVGGPRAVQAAARDADILLSWGIQLDRYLGDAPRPLSVQVVHGDGPWNRFFLEGSRRTVDHFIAVSHRVRHRVCVDVPATVIYNGIDDRRLVRSRDRDETRRSLGFFRSDLVVAFCGRLAAEKRVDSIIEAIGCLPPRVKLLVIGSGHLESSLRQLADKHLPGRAIFTSSNGGMGDLYAAADIFCLASNQEGCSLAMLEAMLSGLAVVSTPVGCAAEVIEDMVTGLLFDGSPRDLTRALGLLTERDDWRMSLADDGRRLVERFAGARRMARDYQQLLRGLI